MPDLAYTQPSLNEPVVAGGTVATTLGSKGSGAPAIVFGSGAPTLVVNKGSFYLRTDGSSSSTRLYVASDSAGTWVAVTTAS